MGDRFLILEDTAEALAEIDPDLATRFRVVNGLPQQAGAGARSIDPDATGPMDPATRHEIRMDVGDRQIQCDCICGVWSSVVDWDEIDQMVVQIREHLGPVDAMTRDGITATSTSFSATTSEKRAG